jgi:hypothetical protein
MIADAARPQRTPVPRRGPVATQEAAMAWKKNSPAAVARFDELAATPKAERKIMFGCPVYQLNGERYALLHENRVVLRLSPQDTADLLAKGGRAFEPIKGRPRKDRIVVPTAVMEDAKLLRAWVLKAARYARAS